MASRTCLETPTVDISAAAFRSPARMSCILREYAATLSAPILKRWQWRHIPLSSLTTVPKVRGL